ncbi:MAG: hypothetical protein ACTSVV_06295 [Promethearchaeota archaeon]
MEKDNIKEKLIKLIQEYDKRCPECGKLFLGIGIEGSTETDGDYPIYLEIKPYPISCGKCPECAKKCYKNFVENIKKSGGRDPCDDEPLNLDDYDKEKYKNIDEYLEHYKLEKFTYYDYECPIYLEQDFEWDNKVPWGASSFREGIVINVFDLIIKELTKHKK